MDSPGTRNTHSNGTSSLARLVTSTDSRGLPASSRSSSTGSPSSRCSQLSRTSSVSRGASQPSTVSSLDTALALAEAERGRDGRGDHGRVGDRHEIGVPGAVGVPPGHLGDHAQRQPRLADPARAHRGHQAVRPERFGQRGPFGGPADEGGQRRGQRQGRLGRGRIRGTQGRRRGRQRPAVVHLELAQQRGHVALDGADRDEQPGGDLRVGQVLPERGQHLGLAGGHAHPRSHRASSHAHTQIVPDPGPAARPRVNAVSAPGETALC